MAKKPTFTLLDDDDDRGHNRDGNHDILGINLERLFTNTNTFRDIVQSFDDIGKAYLIASVAKKFDISTYNPYLADDLRKAGIPDAVPALAREVKDITLHDLETKGIPPLLSKFVSRAKQEPGLFSMFLFSSSHCLPDLSQSNPDMPELVAKHIDQATLLKTFFKLAIASEIFADDDDDDDDWRLSSWDSDDDDDEDEDDYIDDADDDNYIDDADDDNYIDDADDDNYIDDADDADDDDDDNYDSYDLKVACHKYLEILPQLLVSEDVHAVFCKHMNNSTMLPDLFDPDSDEDYELDLDNQVNLVFEYIYHSAFFLVCHACRHELSYEALLSGNSSVAVAVAGDENLHAMSPRAQELFNDKATYTLPECLRMPALDTIKPWPELACYEEDDDDVVVKIFDQVDMPIDSSVSLQIFLENMLDWLQKNKLYFVSNIRYFATCGAVLFLLGKYYEAFGFFVRAIYSAEHDLPQQLHWTGDQWENNPLFANTWAIASYDIKAFNKLLDTKLLVCGNNIDADKIASALAQDAAMFHDPQHCLELLGVPSKSDSSQVSADLLCASSVREVLRCVAFSQAALKRCSLGFFNFSLCAEQYTYQQKWLSLLTNFARENERFHRRQFTDLLNTCKANIVSVASNPYITATSSADQLLAHLDVLHEIVNNYYMLCNPILTAVISPLFVSSDHATVGLNCLSITWAQDLSGAMEKAYKMGGESYEQIPTDPFTNVPVPGVEPSALKEFYSTANLLAATADPNNGERFRCQDFSSIPLDKRVVLSSLPYQHDDVERYMLAYHSTRCLQWFERYNQYAGIADANSKLGLIRGLLVGSPTNSNYYSIGFDKSMTFDQFLDHYLLKKPESATSLKDRIDAVDDKNSLINFCSGTYFALTPVAPDSEECAKSLRVVSPFSSNEDGESIDIFAFTGGAFTTPLSEEGKVLLENLPFKVAHFNDSDTVTQQNSKMTAAERRKFEKFNAIYAAQHYLPKYKVEVFVRKIAPMDPESLSQLITQMLGCLFGVAVDHICLGNPVINLIDNRPTSAPQVQHMAFGDAVAESVIFEQFSRSKLINFNRKFVEGKSRVLVAAKDLPAFVRYCKFDERVSVTDLFDYKFSYKNVWTAAQAKKMRNNNPMVIVAKSSKSKAKTVANIGVEGTIENTIANLSYKWYRFDTVYGESCFPRLATQYCIMPRMSYLGFNIDGLLDEMDFKGLTLNPEILHSYGAAAGFFIVPVDEISSVEYKGVKCKAIAKEIASKLNAFMNDSAVEEIPRYDFVNESFTYMGYAAGREYIYVDYFIWDLPKFMAKAAQIKDSGILQSYGVEHLFYHDFENKGDTVTIV